MGRLPRGAGVAPRRREGPSLSPRTPGLTDRLSGGFGRSSRSLRAERWRRRRRRRRRERCSRHGREPCQENTTSQLSPPIPAAVRTVTGPPALLPPLSPHLGPIVWLGAPGGGGRKDAKEAAARDRESRRSEEGDGEGWL